MRQQVVGAPGELVDGAVARERLDDELGDDGPCAGPGDVDTHDEPRSHHGGDRECRETSSQRGAGRAVPQAVGEGVRECEEPDAGGRRHTRMLAGGDEQPEQQALEHGPAARPCAPTVETDQQEDAHEQDGEPVRRRVGPCGLRDREVRERGSDRQDPADARRSRAGVDRDHDERLDRGADGATGRDRGAEEAECDGEEVHEEGRRELGDVAIERLALQHPDGVVEVVALVRGADRPRPECQVRDARDRQDETDRRVGETPAHGRHAGLRPTTLQL